MMTRPPDWRIRFQIGADCLLFGSIMDLYSDTGQGTPTTERDGALTQQLERAC